MKLSIILATLLLGSANFPQSGNAKADKVNGLDIFIYSTPLNNYEVIDSGKIIVTLTGKCGESVKGSCSPVRLQIFFALVELNCPDVLRDAVSIL